MKSSSKNKQMVALKRLYYLMISFTILLIVLWLLLG
jgi:hypothetical protein